jgi:DMSO/TMAO reductase YedYZ molybdopterin-dependent catalytic subunit
VSGLVAHQRTWSLEELRDLSQIETRIDIHCVTRWSKLGAYFGGVLLQTLLDICQPLPQARFVSFVARSTRRHSTSLSLKDVLWLGTLLALSYEGQPLTQEHGRPIRTVVRDRYFYKSLKWLEEIRLVAEDELGYWEKEAGYHNEADPWREQRYIVPDLDNTLYRPSLL